MGELIPIEIPPGVVSTPTKAKKSSNWREANLIRWNEGQMEPILPWEGIDYTAPATKFRANHQWRGNDGRIWSAFMTEDDILVEDPDTGDLVSIDSVTDPIEPFSSSLVSGGYGDGPMGDDTYGDARADVVLRYTYGPSFTLDNWGENLVYMSSADGRLYEWVPPTVGNPIPNGALVSGAPAGGRTFVVTPERHIIIFGVADVGGGTLGADPAGYAWCDKEDNTDWNVASTASQAGALRVEPAAPIVAAKKIDDGIVIFTTRFAYIIRYIGLPYIYSHDLLAGGGLPVSSASLARAGDKLCWPSASGWWIFNGSSIQPLPCGVWPWITDNMVLDYARLYACSIHLAKRSEIWFSFPTDDSGLNKRTVIYNYREGWWSQGQFGRTSGFAEDAMIPPVMTNGTMAYQHESGVSYVGADAAPFVESFTIYAGAGSSMSIFKQMMPEFEGDIDDVHFSLAYKFDRTPDSEVYTSDRDLQDSGFVDFMQSGRDFRLRVAAYSLEYSEFSLGSLMIDLSPIGRRSPK